MTPSVALMPNRIGHAEGMLHNFIFIPPAVALKHNYVAAAAALMHNYIVLAVEYIINYVVPAVALIHNTLF